MPVEQLFLDSVHWVCAPPASFPVTPFHATSMLQWQLSDCSYCVNVHTLLSVLPINFMGCPLVLVLQEQKKKGILGSIYFTFFPKSRIQEKIVCSRFLWFNYWLLQSKRSSDAESEQTVLIGTASNGLDRILAQLIIMQIQMFTCLFSPSIPVHKRKQMLFLSISCRTIRTWQVIQSYLSIVIENMKLVLKPATKTGEQILPPPHTLLFLGYEAMPSAVIFLTDGHDLAYLL